MNLDNLRGLRVLNTRPRLQSDALSQRITAAHGQVINCPALEIISSTQPWLNALSSLDNVQHAIFTSVNAVNHSLPLLSQQQLTCFLHIQVTAIGKATAQTLRARQIRVDHIPNTSSSEHLILLDCLQRIQHDTILLFKGEGGRTVIAETLQNRGANVIELNVYQRIIPVVNLEQLESWWQEEAIDIILFTSVQSMKNIFILFGHRTHAWLRRIPCLVISERLAKAAAIMNIQKVIVCTLDTIIETLACFRNCS